MKVSLNFLVRIVGMLVLTYVGGALGESLSNSRPDELQITATRLLMLAGAGLGLLVTPRLTIDPILNLLNQSRHIPLSELFLVGLGSMIGLFFAVLITVPLSKLPSPFGTYLPIIVAGVAAYVGATIFSIRKRDMIDSVRQWRRNAPALTLGTPAEPAVALHRYILDTSTIIDGRIAAVVETGFLNGSLIVPSFVLTELQQLADSNDELRRAKGRRGLELLNTMQKQSPLPIEVLNVEVAGVKKVDDKLVAMARQYDCPVITNDFNLNRVASLQGVKVLSLNQLSEAVRPPVVQDQRLQVLIRNEGNARQQGVGYLDDGTPVIVEDARHLIGKTIEVSVIRLHQTQTGRLVFAQLIEEA